jgi:polar amino acid transport system permease protein
MKGFDFVGFISYFGNGFLWRGALTTLWLTAIPIAAGLVLGTFVALMNMSKNRALQGFAQFYIWIFRGTPLLIQLVIIYTGLPQFGIRLGVVESALIALTLNETAYLAEIIRSGFLGVPAGQREAALSLGSPSWLVIWKILLPQAFRLMIPPLGNSVNGLLKATSITSVISMEELMRRSQMLMQEKFDVLEVFCCAAVIYLVMTTVWTLFQRQLEIYFHCEAVPATAE